MIVVLHGTTRLRAESICKRGPDPDFIEPGGGVRAEGFSTCLVSGPFPLGTPQEYARRKAEAFPNEGGPVILLVEVPEELIAKAVEDVCFPLSQGVIQFDEGAVLEELCTAWATLSKQILAVEGV